VVPARNATRKSAPSTGPAASTQSMASATGAPGAGADDDVPGWPVVVVGNDPAARDGVIGVSWVARGGAPDICEHPATSSDAANNTGIRIVQG